MKNRYNVYSLTFVLMAGIARVIAEGMPYHITTQRGNRRQKTLGFSLFWVGIPWFADSKNDIQVFIMRDIDLFQMALGLTPPWQVSDAQFDPNTKRLDIRIDFPRGSTFTCPKCGQTGMKAYDTQDKSWRHLNFFQHDAYLTARVPRIECNGCGTLLVDVPMGQARRQLHIAVWSHDLDAG